ncbi:MAG: CRISPR-associated endonuclease Cas1 [Spirochaetota bacterium]
MSDIYLISDYGKLYRNNRMFNFLYPDGTVSKFFPHNTQRLFIIGNIEITPEALKLLMHCKIEVVFLNKNGLFNGKLVFDDSKNVLLRKKQYDKLNNEQFILQWCKSIIDGKIQNQLVLANRIKRKHKETTQLQDCVSSMKNIIEKLETATTTNELRGYEGAASRMYFGAIKHAIIPHWAEFNGRSMNPPRDNVNAVLSFTYTLLNHLIESYIISEGMDTYVGYLHTVEYGRKSLIFDLMEEFRSPVCDTLTVALFNLGILNPEDFRTIDFSSNDDEYPLEPMDEEEDTVTTRKGVLLTKEGLKKVIEKFEAKLEETYYYMPLQKQLSYRKIIAQQVAHCKRVINDEESQYKPFEVK